jgi:benzoate membrane transport protein
MAQPERRFAATVTLTVTASGVAAFGIGAAFWGLLAGLAVHAAEQARRHAGSARP